MFANDYLKECFHICHTLAIYENGTTHLIFETQNQRK